MSIIPVALVAARARNGVIGRDGGLPWRLRSDLQRFKAVTIGKPCLMGRATWEGLALRPLPGRLNLILTRDLSFEARGGVVVHTLDEGLEMAREQAREDGAVEVCVIGGAQVYAAALPRARRIYMTEVEAEPEGDTLFPPFDEDAFVEIARERHEPGDRDDHAFVFRVLERR